MKTIHIHRKKTPKQQHTASQAKVQNPPPVHMPNGLDEKLNLLGGFEKTNGDVQTIDLVLNKVPHCVICINGMVDLNALRNFIIQPLRIANERGTKLAANDLVYAGTVVPIRHPEEMVEYLCRGDVLLLWEGKNGAYAVEMPGNANIRSISDSIMERSALGGRESFVESLATNTGMLRQKLKGSNLTIEYMQLGRRTKSQAAIVHISDITDDRILHNVKEALAQIDVDSINSVGQLSEFLEGNPYSVFPQTKMTDRPDIVVADLLDGRICVLVDQMPHALIMPSLFLEMFQAIDDYALRPIQGTYMRCLRFIAFILSVCVPGLLLSFLSFHHTLIPTELLSPLMLFEFDVPLPIYAQIALLEVLLQLLVEGTIRLPTISGSTIGIVGAVILGQALSLSRLASPLIILSMTISMMASFCIPNYYLSLSGRILRWVVLLFSVLFGLYGFSVSCMLLLLHVASLESFKVPYTAPIAPLHHKDWLDTLVRFPARLKRTRPTSIPTKDKIRKGGVV